jgi:hypothetical protein
MSIGCIIQVFQHSASSGNDRLVLLCIADEADDEGSNAFPSIRRIADKANCHTDTVVECIKRLEALGELEVKRPDTPGRGRFNRYRVILGNLGISDISDRGSIYGSVEGLVRTQPRQKEHQPAPKQDDTRAKTDGFARFPQPRPWCDACEATGRTKNDDGDFTFEPCKECA